jgi:hypothetical protein
MPIDFKTMNYFTGMPYYLGFLLLLVGILGLLSGTYVFVFIGWIPGIIIVTTHYRLSVDFNNRKYVEYISLLGIKTGREVGKFQQLQYLFIKKSRVSQQLNSRVQSTTIYKWQYDGYLKFSDEDKVHLMTFENKSTLQQKLNTIAQQLNTKVVDYSDENRIEA